MATAKVMVVGAGTLGSQEAVAVLSQAGFRAVTLSRVDAAGLFCRTFAPDLAVVLASEVGGKAHLEIARKLRQVSGGSLPVLYLYVGSRSFREACLQCDAVFDAISFSEELPLLPARVRAVLRLCDGLRRSLTTGGAQPNHHAVAERATTRLFAGLLEHEIRRGERHGDSFSVMVVKLLRFPRFRKSFGAEMGDRLLVFASVAITQTFRESDTLARIGEAEFGLLLPGAPAEEAGQLAFRLGSRFASSRFEVAGQYLKPEVSIGIASFPDLLGPPEAYLRAGREDAHARRAPLSIEGSQLRLAQL